MRFSFNAVLLSFRLVAVILDLNITLISGDSIRHHSVVGYKFSTYDRDNYVNCASQSGGGWWFMNCNIFTLTHGEHATRDAFEWRKYVGNLASATMMIRP